MRRLRWLIVLAALALALIPLLGDLGPSSRPSTSGGGVARVERVVDGDTIKVDLDGRTERVRYIGVDTPETVKPGTGVQCFGHEASARNSALVAGREVRLVVGDEARDRYGRLLAYVYRTSDDTFVNEALVRDGYARTMTIPPNDRYAPRFAALQARARSDGRGLWGRCR